MHFLKKSVGLVAASGAFIAGTAIAQQMPFNDVPSNHWAAQAISWAYQNDIMTGPGDMQNQFLPARSVNRAELATVLARLHALLMEEMEELEERIEMLEEELDMAAPQQNNNGLFQFPPFQQQQNNNTMTTPPATTTSPSPGTTRTMTGATTTRDSTTINITLGGNEEVPPVTPSGRGNGQFTLNKNGLSYDIRVEGLTSPILSAHFHQGERGQNGPIIEPIVFEGSRATGTWRNLTAAQRRMLENGEVYVNVHTQRNPEGEIRGQLLFRP